MPSLEKETVRQGKHTPGRFGCEYKSRILVAIYQLVSSLLTFSWTSLTYDTVRNFAGGAGGFWWRNT